MLSLEQNQIIQPFQYGQNVYLGQIQPFLFSKMKLLLAVGPVDRQTVDDLARNPLNSVI